jgi:orotidine-5'-phosphate decarboxylase
MHAIETINRLMEEHDTLVCAGIDPNLALFPEEIRNLDIPDEAKVQRFLERYIEAVAPYVCAFKAQKAYFDVFSDGHKLLQDVIDHAQTHHSIPVIVDCKIGDIEETMAAYRQNIFELLGAAGVVVNPYMGDDVMLPLAQHADKAIVPLVKTSNPGGSIVQDIRTENGRYVWEEILHLVTDRWNGSRNMIPVIASTQNVDLVSVRRTIPDDMPIFFAGVGAQGGSIDSVRQLLDQQGRGVLVNSSRGLMYPEKERFENWPDAILRSVRTMRDRLNDACR